MMRGADPPLVTVMVWAVAATPTVVLGKVSEVGDRLTAGTGTTPVPDSETVCGELEALSEMLIVAASDPPVVGLKVTVTVQNAPAATVAAQSLVSEKEVAFVPPTVMGLRARTYVPELVSLTVCVAADDPTVVLAKVNDVGASVTAGAMAVTVVVPVVVA